MSKEAKKSSKPNDSISYATSLLKEQTVFPIISDTQKSIVEFVMGPEDDMAFHFWKNGTEYTQESEPEIIEFNPDDKMDPENLQHEPVGTAIWLFGPGRTSDSLAIMSKLTRFLTKGSRLILASENPWPGKMLCKDEFEEYTNEEMAALLLRAGYGEITEIVDGPFFRLWETEFEGPLANSSLFDASSEIENGNWQEAEKILEKVSESLGSIDAVKEYALMVGECHILAGRTEPAATALSEALQLDPVCSRALCCLGRVAISVGDIDGAKDFFELALTHQPAFVSALCGRAAVSEIQGDKELAYRSMKEASDLRPYNEELMIEAIRLGNATGRHEETVKLFIPRNGVNANNGQINL